MSFNGSNMVETHLRNLLADAASARLAQLFISPARTGSRIAGLGWHYIAPAEHYLFCFRLGSTVGRGRQLQ